MNQKHFSGIFLLKQLQKVALHDIELWSKNLKLYCFFKAPDPYIVRFLMSVKREQKFKEMCT